VILHRPKDVDKIVAQALANACDCRINPVAQMCLFSLKKNKYPTVAAMLETAVPGGYMSLSAMKLPKQAGFPDESYERYKRDWVEVYLKYQEQILVGMKNSSEMRQFADSCNNILKKDVEAANKAKHHGFSSLFTHF